MGVCTKTPALQQNDQTSVHPVHLLPVVKGSDGAVDTDVLMNLRGPPASQSDL